MSEIAIKGHHSEVSSIDTEKLGEPSIRRILADLRGPRPSVCHNQPDRPVREHQRLGLARALLRRVDPADGHPVADARLARPYPSHVAGAHAPAGVSGRPVSTFVEAKSSTVMLSIHSSESLSHRTSWIRPACLREAILHA